MIKKIRLFITIRNIILTIGGLLILLIVGSTIKKATTPVTVEIGQATRGSVSEVVAVSGYLEAARKSNLSFGATTSKITWLNTKVGDVVATGSALLALDQTSLQSDVVAAQAAVAQAEAAYNSAKAGEIVTYETYNNVRYDGSARIDALKDQAYEAARSADDGVTRAQATLTSAKANLAKSVLTAPISGTVTLQNAVLGEIPTASPLVQIIDLNSFYFRALVDELDIYKISLGQSVSIKLNTAKDKELLGTVTSISPTTIKDGNNNVSIEVKITITDFKGLTLRLGLEGDAQIIVSEHSNALLVPFEAVAEENGQKYVWEVKYNVVTKRAVSTGLEGELTTEITSGLSDGAVVVLSPAKTLIDNQRITQK